MTKPKREVPQQVANQLRRTIVAGDLADGAPLGNEAELIEQFGVSRPSLREALRILEAEGLISVQRGVQGGVVARRPEPRIAARSAALVLQSRNVSLADVLVARNLIEPAAVRSLASQRNVERALQSLREHIAAEVETIDDADGFGQANARFHEELVRLGGSETLTILIEMLHEVVERAVASAVRSEQGDVGPATRRRGIRSQERLLELIEAGDPDASEAHWRAHLDVVAQVTLGQRARTVVDLLDSY